MATKNWKERLIADMVGRGGAKHVSGVTLGGEKIAGYVSVARAALSPKTPKRKRASEKPKAPRSGLSVPAAWGRRFLRNAERELAERRAREAGEIVDLPTAGRVRRRRDAA